MGEQLDLLQGTLDLLILKTLALEPMHGWGIGQRIQQISKEVLQVGQGSLYPALHRLESRGWIASEWSTSDNSKIVILGHARLVRACRRPRHAVGGRTSRYFRFVVFARGVKSCARPKI